MHSTIYLCANIFLSFFRFSFHYEPNKTPNAHSVSLASQTENVLSFFAFARAHYILHGFWLCSL
uniref:Uncharacterized protein n=1 Tax=Nelumbo nucifera TaxID=4432 RepID=A0A822Y9G7_NELNU|nr:TPA_asm: hypothetical protein HUJ06_030515 [Nelumbo nucifera]